MEARNTKVTYLFCMLELLNGPHLESHDVDRVLIFLGSLKDNANMMWVRRTTIQQFGCKWNEGLELVVKGWLGCHGNYDDSKWEVDYYDYNLYMYCKANQEMTYFVYMLICQYGLPF
ncbi:hypothetical protein CJ030_MR1G022546 [Morella rubra]|uniref:Uncharacterized protein n=1 Tax=Morella rubra TaxID=262757 RepID=A0A6A1WN46_9ROSI|nr:hypothetical protein CJ030_MR1G022546 [Morella rubra]